MINLPDINSVDVAGKRVLVRADLDVNSVGFENDLRIQSLLPTLDLLRSKNAQIILLGHKGRPASGEAGGVDLSLGFLQPFFDKWGAEVKENLRLDQGEEENNAEYAAKLAALGEVYINEAFAASHREHASIVGVPKLLPHAAGLRFVAEVTNLSKVFEAAKKPVVTIVGGVKEDKLTYLNPLAEISDYVLVGGALPNFISDDSMYRVDARFLVANLNPDKEDLTIRSIENFEAEIAKAGTILLTGPMGKYEEGGHLMGTKRVFEAVANSPAFKISGGGDTIKAINSLGLSEKFDWLSVGGGATLEFITKKTLPGIEALQ
jgi:phosphoglycerate kinase